MLFSSMEFLFFFFPVVYGVYYLLKPGAQNYWLLLASLFFYAWGEPSFVLVLIASILINYGLALLIERNGDGSGKKKYLLILDIILNLGILFTFKYLNFTTGILRDLFPFVKGVIPATSIVLPIGISFFTFQALSYVIDVYRGGKAQKNPAYLGLYISLFPQLIAGPIVRYSTISGQIENREITFSSFSEGAMQFLRGLNKKMLLANVLAEAADRAFAAKELSVGMAWLGAICYAMQIYFDFSGYSDMAIGLGAMLGFRFEKNFDYPYISKTVTEFWRRWHISLGRWFRDYVYIPLGGSRVRSRGRLAFNLLFVWLLTGAWHGAEWTFLLWGGLHGLVIVLEKMLDIPARLEPGNRSALRGIYRIFTALVVLIGWVFFRADNLQAAWTYICAMVGGTGNALTDYSFEFFLRDYAVYIAAGILICTPVLERLKNWIQQKGNPRFSVCVEIVSDTAQVLLFIIGVSFLIMNSHNPFIYFNF